MLEHQLQPITQEPQISRPFYHIAEKKVCQQCVQQNTPTKTIEMSTNLRSRKTLTDLLHWYNHRPRFSGLAKHLLSLQQLATVKDLLFYDLGRGGRGVDRLLNSIDVGDNHTRRQRCVREAVQLDDARRVRLLGLARVALRQELHARGLARVQRVVLYHHFREEFQHFFLLPLGF